jgi:hypothetical protein
LQIFLNGIDFAKIQSLEESKQFKDQYSKYLRKRLNPPATMIKNLDTWYSKYKVTSSDPEGNPVGGRLDPVRKISLFTMDTKLVQGEGPPFRRLLD